MLILRESSPLEFSGIAAGWVGLGISPELPETRLRPSSGEVKGKEHLLVEVEEGRTE